MRGGLNVEAGFAGNHFKLFQDEDYQQYMPRCDANGNVIEDPIADNGNFDLIEKDALHALTNLGSTFCSTLSSIVRYRISAKSMIISILAIPFTLIACIVYLTPAATFYDTEDYLGIPVRKMGEPGKYWAMSGAYLLNVVLSLYVTMEALKSLLGPFESLFRAIFSRCFSRVSPGSSLLKELPKFVYLILGIVSALVMVSLQSDSDLRHLPGWLETTLEFPGNWLLLLVGIGSAILNYIGLEKMLSSPRPYVKWVGDVIKFIFMLPLTLLTATLRKLQLLRVDASQERNEAFLQQADLLKNQLIANLEHADREINREVSRGAKTEEIKQLLQLLAEDSFNRDLRNSKTPYKDAFGRQNPETAMEIFLRICSFTNTAPIKQSNFLWTSINNIFSLSTVCVVLCAGTLLGYYTEVCNGVNEMGEKKLHLSDAGLSAFKYLVGSSVIAPFVGFICLHIGDWIGKTLTTVLSKIGDGVKHAYHNSSIWMLGPNLISEIFHRLRPTSMIGRFSFWMMLIPMVCLYLLAPASTFTSLRLNMQLSDPARSPAWVVWLAEFVVFKMLLQLNTSILPMLINSIPVVETLGRQLFGTIILRLGTKNREQVDIDDRDNYSNTACTRGRLAEYNAALIGNFKKMSPEEFAEVLVGIKTLRAKQDEANPGANVGRANYGGVGDAREHNHSARERTVELGKAATHNTLATLFGTNNAAALVTEYYQNDRIHMADDFENSDEENVPAKDAVENVEETQRLVAEDHRYYQLVRTMSEDLQAYERDQRHRQNMSFFQRCFPCCAPTRAQEGMASHLSAVASR